jgi:adenosylcobinamide-phosphate synthase
MNFLALVGALALSYYRPHSRLDWLQQVFSPYAKTLERNFNGGKNRHGVLAWVLAVFLPAFLLGVGYWVLHEVSPFLGVLCGIVILYATLRFSQFGKRAELIVAALRNNDLEEARQLLSSWESTDASQYSATQMARVSIETMLRRAHQGLFAPIFWFVILGPAGALLYRLAHLAKTEWRSEDETLFNHFARKAFECLDWLPARITAGSFAVVGDFEDAVYCWRTQAETWPDRILGIVLTSGAGALGVKVGEPLPQTDKLEFRPEIGMGDEADADYLQSSIGLVWRVLVLMVGLLLLLTFAHWLGN